MSDADDTPFAPLTLDALVRDRERPPPSITVRISKPAELPADGTDAAAPAVEVDLTLALDPYAAPLAPNAAWQAIGPLPALPPVEVREGGRPAFLPDRGGEAAPESAPGAPPATSNTFWFAEREAQGIEPGALLADQRSAVAIVIGADLELTEIPIVGGRMPPELGLGLRGLAILCTPDGKALVPDLWVRNEPFVLPMLMLDRFDEGPAPGGSSPSSIPAIWFDVRKALGPLDLHRMGLGFADEKLWFLMDASLKMGPATLTAIGLGMGIHLGDLFAGEPSLPAFHIDGVGLEIRQGGTTVGGALMRQPRSREINGETVDYTGYAGGLIIRTGGTTFSALGLFESPPGGAPSFFAYGSRNQPMGGPPFFFVTKLSLGLGVNTRFRLPGVELAHTFPLLRDANRPDLPAAPNLADLIRVAGDLAGFQEPAEGTVVLAAGVVGTSFGLINTSLVLLATIGRSVLVDLIGQSVMKLTADGWTVARVRMNWRGQWSPGDDSIAIRGQVERSSWAFHSRFRLAGQMALEAWIAGPHAGDFVFTVGGYHPAFRAPAHYPKANRLSLGWTERIGDWKIEVKGEGYCALTPSALMTGGALSYTLRCGDIKAWYAVGADFLLQWHPFRYRADLSLSIGASYTLDIDLGFLGSITKTFTVSVGADVELWGPDLGGEVSFDICDIIDVSFSFGADDGSQSPLSWAEFAAGFLSDDPLGIRATDGLRAEKEDGQGDYWVVDATSLAVAIDWGVPALSLVGPDEAEEVGADFGIQPMGIGVGDVAGSRVTVQVLDADGQRVPCKYSPVTRNLPRAVWGGSGGRDRLMPGLLAGVTLDVIGEAPESAVDSVTLPVPHEMINWDPHHAPPDDWVADTVGQGHPGDYASARVAASATGTRAALLRDLYGLDAQGVVEPDEIRSWWVGELQETPTLKTREAA